MKRRSLPQSFSVLLTCVLVALLAACGTTPAADGGADSGGGSDIAEDSAVGTDATAQDADVATPDSPAHIHQATRYPQVVTHALACVAGRA